jgi:hypothetical protein
MSSPELLFLLTRWEQNITPIYARHHRSASARLRWAVEPDVARALRQQPALRLSPTSPWERHDAPRRRQRKRHDHASHGKPCVSCPLLQCSPDTPNTLFTVADVRRAAAQCVYGCEAGEYLRNSSTAVPPEGLVPSVFIDCAACPENATSPAGATNLSECLCDPGFTGPAGGPCTPCAAGTYKNGSGTQMCSLCPEGTFSEVPPPASIRAPRCALASTPCIGANPKRVSEQEEAGDSILACEECPGNSTTTSPAGSNSSDECVCRAGYEGTTSEDCVECIAGATFSNESGSPQCSYCESGPCQSGYYRVNCTTTQDSECVPCTSAPLRATFTSPGVPDYDDNCSWACPLGMAPFVNGSNVSACEPCTWACPDGYYRDPDPDVCDCLPCKNWKPPGSHYSSPGEDATFWQCSWLCDDGLPPNTTDGEECGIFCRV